MGYQSCLLNWRWKLACCVADHDSALVQTIVIGVLLGLLYINMNKRRAWLQLERFHACYREEVPNPS